RQTGLLKFKKKWGGVQHPMSYYFYLNGAAEPPNFDSSSPAYELLRKTWARLPTPVCKTLGAWVTRQLS
ncbi:MAG: FemAB family XrtA/PEP-CTERM system-associated protein, partial [Pyrinomonadaceae bacterium]